MQKLKSIAAQNALMGSLLLLLGGVVGAFALFGRASHTATSVAGMLPAFLAALLFATVFIGLIRDFAIRKSLVDKSRSVRKVHVKEVPRLGGVGFVLAWYVVVGILLAADPHLRHEVVATAPRSYTFLFGGLFVAGIGAADDLFGLRARHKLVGQVLVAFALCLAGFAVPSVHLPTGHILHLGVLSYPLTMLWIVGAMNAVNLIDGLDGLAAGVSQIALGAVLVLSLTSSLPALGTLSAALSGALLGFLFYNFNPASIFMGDTGSLFLGYFLSVALCVASRQPATGATPLAVPLLVLALPVADTALAICRRSLRGKGVFSPDREHIHHRLLGMGLSHRATVLALYGASFVAASAALGLAFGRPSTHLFIWAALALAAVATMRLFGMHENLSFSKLRVDRRRNLDLRAALTTIAGRLEEAKGLHEVVESLGGIVPAVSADTVHARFNGHAADHHFALPEDAVHMRFPLEHGKEDLGFVHIVWTDGRAAVEQDHALAIEELCGHVTKAVRRLTPLTVARATTAAEAEAAARRKHAAS